MTAFWFLFFLCVLCIWCSANFCCLCSMTCVRALLQSSRTAHLIVIRSMVVFRRHTDQQLCALQAVVFAWARCLLLVDLYVLLLFGLLRLESMILCPAPCTPPPPTPPVSFPLPSIYDDHFQLITTWGLYPAPHPPTHLPAPFPYLPPCPCPCPP